MAEGENARTCLTLAHLFSSKSNRYINVDVDILEVL